MMSYLGAIRKSIKGSGFEEIVFEANLCASGSIDRVQSGKHYNRSLRVHIVMTEALERLLFNHFIQCSSKPKQARKLYSDIYSFKTNMNNEELNKVLECESFNDLFYEYEYFKQLIRRGSNGKTAQFWLQYIDRVWLLLQFSFATRQNDSELHIISLEKLCPLLFCMDHQGLNLPDTAKKLLENNGFSVARSSKQAARVPVDLTIEQTINKHAKTKGGIVGFSKNMPAYYRWSSMSLSMIQFAIHAFS